MGNSQTTHTGIEAYHSLRLKKVPAQDSKEHTFRYVSAEETPDIEHRSSSAEIRRASRTAQKRSIEEALDIDIERVDFVYHS